MRRDQRAIRERQIEAAAYAVLEEQGYQGASMLRIARRARASNETLYRWYGDKQGLFRAIVARNAREVRDLLDGEIAAGRDVDSILISLGPTLLGLLVGKKAVALNRAAVADPTGELGAAVAEAGRDTVMPLIEQVFEGALNIDAASGPRAKEAAELYLNLLVGDLQIRRVIGALGPLGQSEIARRAERARLLTLRLLEVSDQ